jgi:hypothetical protein
VPTDDDAQRRAELKTKWAKARAQDKARKQPSQAPVVGQSQTRKQVASRVQRAASEALAALRRQREDGRP